MRASAAASLVTITEHRKPRSTPLASELRTSSSAGAGHRQTSGRSTAHELLRGATRDTSMSRPIRSARHRRSLRGPSAALLKPRSCTESTRDHRSGRASPTTRSPRRPSSSARRAQHLGEGRFNPPLDGQVAPISRSETRCVRKAPRRPARSPRLRSTPATRS